MKDNKASGARYRAKLKQRMFDHYGRVCACCGEGNEKFLTLDHTDDSGAKHRRSISRDGTSRGGHTLYRDLIRLGFPDYIQVLCWNCNSGRQYNGGICPHLEAPTVS